MSRAHERVVSTPFPPYVRAGAERALAQALACLLGTGVHVHVSLALRRGSPVVPDPCVVEMGNTSLERAETYGAWLKQGVSDDELIAIRKHVPHERTFGSQRFQIMEEKTLGRPVSLQRP